MAALQTITSRKAGGQTVYDFTCPHPIGCGTEPTKPGDGEAFSSTGWADREHAVERGRQHLAEHDGTEVMEDLQTFRVSRGLAPDPTATAVPDFEL